MTSSTGDSSLPGSASGPASYVGRVLGDRYQLLSIVGQGGMGAVYEAIQLDLGRRVAVKVLFDADPNALARFRQEAFASASLNHPHVVQVTDLVVVEGSPPFIVMELLAGESLASLLERGPIEMRRAIRLAAQTLAALAEAHRAGVIHRDVKPSNIFLVKMPHETDHVKLLDFGIAKLLDAGGFRTATGLMVGTPAYMSPEQARGLPPDPRTDVHAMGLILFEMIAGRRAFPERDVPALLTAVCTVVPPRLDAIMPEVPRALADILVAATAKDPSKRFATAEAMGSALSPWLLATGRPNIMASAPPPAVVTSPPPHSPAPAPHVGAGSTVYEPAAPAALLPATPYAARTPYQPIVVPDDALSNNTTRKKRRTAPPRSRLPIFLIALAATVFGAIVAFVAALAYLGRL